MALGIPSALVEPIAGRAFANADGLPLPRACSLLQLAPATPAAGLTSGRPLDDTDRQSPTRFVFARCAHPAIPAVEHVW